MRSEKHPPPPADRVATPSALGLRPADAPVRARPAKSGAPGPVEVLGLRRPGGPGAATGHGGWGCLARARIVTLPKVTARLGCETRMSAPARLGCTKKVAGGRRAEARAEGAGSGVGCGPETGTGHTHTRTHSDTHARARRAHTHTQPHAVWLGGRRPTTPGSRAPVPPPVAVEGCWMAAAKAVGQSRWGVVGGARVRQEAAPGQWPGPRPQLEVRVSTGTCFDLQRLHTMPRRALSALHGPPPARSPHGGQVQLIEA